MNGNTAAVVMGAVVIAGAAAVAVWMMKNKQAAPVAGVQAPAVVQPALVHTYAPSPAQAAPVARPAITVNSIASGVANAAATVGNIVNTGKKVLDSVTSLFKGFKLF